MNKRYIYYFLLIIVIILGFILLPIKEGFQKQKTNQSIILLGDSILQNQSYVSRGNSVYDFIPNAICYAKDNSRIIDVYGQIEKIQDTNNAVFILSIGGNDLLYYPNSIEPITLKYTKLIEWIKQRFPKIQLYVLDIYYPPCIIQQYPKMKQWNHFLYSLASEKDLQVIKISKILNQPEDFTQCIEPSNIGSKKIAKLILDQIY